MGVGNLQVDHNHETKQVRDLLCHSCNTGLGKFKDSVELLEAATQYLKRHNSLASSDIPINLPNPVQSIESIPAIMAKVTYNENPNLKLCP